MKGQKKELEIKLENYFGRVFSETKSPASKTLGDCLDAQPSWNLSRTNHNNERIYGEVAYQWKIKNEIGSDLTKLIDSSSEETPQQAYQRHIAIIRNLTRDPIRSKEELVARIDAYPDYNMFSLITDADFAGIFSSMQLFAGFLKDYPAYKSRAIERILTHDADFARLFNWVDTLRLFLENPEYKSRAIERIFNHDVDFARLFDKLSSLSLFFAFFSEYKDQTIERILTRHHDFTRIIPDAFSLGRFMRAFPGYAQRAKQIFVSGGAKQIEEKSGPPSTVSSTGIFSISPQSQSNGVQGSINQTPIWPARLANFLKISPGKPSLS